ncbi:MAG: DUF1554 domain-containing protein [Leptospiraceae bacterium]
MQFYKRKFLTTIAVAISTLMLSASCEQLGLTEDDDDTDLLVLLGIALTPESCSGTCKMFLTSSVPSRNIGLTGLDNVCNSDANKPSGNIAFKALVTHSTDRIACTTANCSGGVSENVNWVLKPNTKYVRSDGTTEIFTTNSSGIFPFGTANDGIVDPATNGIPTGLHIDWTNDLNCSDWSGAGSYEIGAPEELGVDMISLESPTSCGSDLSGILRLACVEQ